MAQDHKPQLARVLIVEDNEAQRKVLLAMMQEEGFSTYACSTAGEVLERLRDIRPAVAIVDQRLPDASGIQVLSQIRRVDPAVRVIMHTGYGSFDSARDALNLGAFGYIEKLGQPQDLIQQVHRAAGDWMAEVLQQTEARYRQLIESVRAIVWAGSAETGAYAYVSPEAEKLLGYPAREWIGDADFWSAHLHPDDREQALALRRAAVAAQQQHVLEYRMQTADGQSVWFRDVVNVRADGDGPAELIGVMVDITREKAAEQAVYALNAQLEQRVEERTARLERVNKELEAFAYSVSHDLRAPLRAISGFAEILERRHRAVLDDEARHYVDNIIEASARLDMLINDLLSYARLGRSAISYQRVALGDLVERVCRVLAPQILEAGAVVQIPEHLPALETNAALIERILTNLVENALAYRRDGVPPRIEIGCSVLNHMVQISVADNGQGIPASYQEKIFQVFQRLHDGEAYPGTGVGLAVVKKVVAILDGIVWVESREGVGSTFYLRLPQHRQPDALAS